MTGTDGRNPTFVTAYTLVVGVVGAALGYALSFPVFVLTGPAILIMALSLTGMHFAITDKIRDAALLLIGVGIGSGVNAQATDAFLRWPVAFAVLGAMLVAILLSSRHLLMRGFGYDRQSAVLSATPGHLSFVLTMGTTLNLNVAQIAVVQAVRLFSLTMIVPFAAAALGVDLTAFPPMVENPMGPLQIGLLLVVGAGLGYLLQLLKVPAPMLMGGLIVSTIAHVFNLTPGPLPPAIALPGFLVVGAMIGTRFSGVSLSLLKSSLLAGLSVTLLSLTWSLLAATIVAGFLNMPLLHVLVAFAPGGLETMIALGAVIGANPGFVAASHVARLLILILLVPLLLPRQPATS